MMRKFIITSVLLLFIAVFAHGLDVPVLQGRVNDYAGMLSPATIRGLESKLADFENSESTQVVVLTIPSLAGENLEDYSIKVAEAWRIGHKDVDNGVILLIAKQDRQIRIEVGRGLEGKLTDLVSGRIIREQIAPHFKADDFDGGVVSAVSAIMAVVKGEYKGAGGLGQTGKEAPPVMTLGIFLMVACIFMGAISRLLGGVVGAIGLPVLAALAFPGLALAVLASFALPGFILGLFVSFLFGSGSRGGGRWSGPHIGGGWGGGSFGGGGGFSGGGGSFGGGGASGNW